MSYALIDTTDLTSLGNAIRTKTGGSSNLTVSQMATAVSNISSGGGSLQPSYLVNIQGNAYNTFTYDAGCLVLNNFLNQISMTGIYGLNYAFSYLNRLNAGQLDLSSLNIYLSQNSNITMANCFQGSLSISKLPTFVFTNTSYVYDCSYMFSECNNILSVEDFMNDLVIAPPATAGEYNKFSYMFQYCTKLKHIPHLEKLQTLQSSEYYHIYKGGFAYCNFLEEIENLPVSQATLTNNCFGDVAQENYCLGRFTFETNNGVPYTANWKNQNIDLTNYIGYFVSWAYAQQLKDINVPEVNSAATYNQYKNGMYYTNDVEYSRYNHTSAVETINSLPDTSGQTNPNNTIRFLGDSGSLTDGGAISTLTSAEIAVATAKGWNVVIV